MRKPSWKDPNANIEPFHWEESDNNSDTNSGNGSGNNIGNATYFVTITEGAVKDIDAEAFKMSELSSEELEKNVRDCKQILKEKYDEIHSFAQNNLNSLKAFAATLHDQINIDKVYIYLNIVNGYIIYFQIVVIYYFLINKNIMLIK